MSGSSRSRKFGFSLIELVIVVVIIAIIAAIAIPRMSRGAAGAQDSTLTTNLRILRAAVELYATEHGGVYPSAADVTSALTQFSNDTGTSFSPTRDVAAGRVYGPYIRQIPSLPIDGPRKGGSLIAATDGPDVGWIYSINVAGVGEFRANTTSELDSKGTPYSAY